MRARNLAAAGLCIALAVYFLYPPSSYEIRNASTVGKSIFCFGDSLTYGTGAGRGKDYPSQLAGFIGRTVVNAGVPGETTGSALQRLDQIISQKPGYVLITLGGNDLRRKLNKETVFDNLEQIVRKFQDNGALVIIGGIDIPFWGRGFAKGYEELARETGAVLVPNIFEDIWVHADLMSDTIHPNSAGYTIMAQHFYQALQPYL